VAFTEPKDAIAHFCRHIPEISPSDSIIVKSVKYWIYWNKKAEAIASWRFKIEDLDQEWDEFCERIGHELDKKVLLTVAKDANHRPHKPNVKLTWDYLEKHLQSDLFQELQAMALKYGYGICDEE
jgi:hypothetical protein